MEIVSVSWVQIRSESVPARGYRIFIVAVFCSLECRTSSLTIDRCRLAVPECRYVDSRRRADRNHNTHREPNILFVPFDRGVAVGSQLLVAGFGDIADRLRTEDDVFVSGLFGIGTFSQVNSITSAVGSIFSEAPVLTLFGTQYNLAVVIAGVLLTVAVALVLLGGIKRIAKVSEAVVPFMVIVYVLICLIILFANITAIPQALAQIFVGAFNPKAVAGGVAGSMIVAMQSGIARGIFSNEAGLGSAPIAAASAKTREPVRQGLVSMTGTFLDTLVVCTMTGLAIVITGAWSGGKEGVNITMEAFTQGLPSVLSAAAPVLLMVCLIFFAFTTILGWNFYGERCLEYLTGRKKIALYAYRIAYIAAVFIGPYMTIAAVWNIADIFNGLMALPNLVALLLLSGVVARETKSYFRRFPSAKSGEKDEDVAQIPPAEQAGALYGKEKEDTSAQKEDDFPLSGQGD